MPLVHRFSGPAFAPSESQSKTQKPRAFPASPTESLQEGATAGEPAAGAHCHLCSARVPIFDPSRRCCLDRYESQFGSARKHRAMIAEARYAAMLGDHRPAQRLVESYRRVFGPMAAVELRRSLFRSVGVQLAL